MIRRYVQEMSGKPPVGGVDVDEAVALGAAMRAHIVPSIGEGSHTNASPGHRSSTNETPRVAIPVVDTDATAHSLGVILVSEDGDRYINSKIIKKHAKIPASGTRKSQFRTRDTENELDVYVLQGEHDRPLDNIIIHKYVITGIEQTNPPSTVIHITYQYTADGVIEVSAIQQETGKQLPIRIEPVPHDMSWTDGSPREQGGGGSTVDVVLAIDVSGSMDGEPIAKAKEAMTLFVNQMESDAVQIGLVAFASSTKCVLEPTHNYEDVMRAINTLDEVKVGKGTSSEPFTISYPTLQRKKAQHRYIVVLTDGLWYGKAKKSVSVAQKCHENGIDVMALGFGNADYDFLKKIASVEKFASMTTVHELNSSFSRIGQEIREGSGLVSYSN
jgi:uncharacterized protein YegL